MLQLYPRNGGPAGFWHGTSEGHGNAGDQPTLGKGHWTNTGFDNWMTKAAAYDDWMLLKRDFVFFILYNS